MAFTVRWRMMELTGSLIPALLNREEILIASMLSLPVSSIMRHRTVKAMSEQLSMTSSHTKDAALPLLNQLKKSLAKFIGCIDAIKSNFKD
jgi:hypothetical protein